jgi:hypothetical protein
MAIYLLFFTFINTNAQDSTKVEKVVAASDTNTISKQTNIPVQESLSQATELSDGKNSLLKDSSSQLLVNTPLHRKNIGLNLNVRIFYPKEINNLIFQINKELIRSATMSFKYPMPDLYNAFGLVAKSDFYISSQYFIEPSIGATWGFKWFAVEENEEKLHLIDVIWGANFCRRFKPENRFSFKAGIGIFGSNTFINMNGDLGDVSINGIGLRGNILGGADLKLKKAILNVEFVVPVGYTKFTNRTGSLKPIHEYGTLPRYSYPKKLYLYGLEIRPGLMFTF